ncbi:hypothetical protein HGRIS_006199 [Hohenbuehelia grisea]|uniref:Uncharacterized protein n=1 Tax=Hohenbuehelia grisea TaxID=104357 RepID=A0ABR3JZ45_9AGAR
MFLGVTCSRKADGTEYARRFICEEEKDLFSALYSLSIRSQTPERSTRRRVMTMSSGQRRAAYPSNVHKRFQSDLDAKFRHQVCGLWPEVLCGWYHDKQSSRTILCVPFWCPNEAPRSATKAMFESGHLSISLFYGA